MWSERTINLYTSSWLCIHTMIGPFQPIMVISESVCFYWLLYTALLSNYYELIGCWDKWRAFSSKTGLCWQPCLQVTPSAGLRQSSLLRCNFPCNCFIWLWIFFSKLASHLCLTKRTRGSGGEEGWLMYEEWTSQPWHHPFFSEASFAHLKLNTEVQKFLIWIKQLVLQRKIKISKNITTLVLREMLFIINPIRPLKMTQTSFKFWLTSSSC